MNEKIYLLIQQICKIKYQVHCIFVSISISISFIVSLLFYKCVISYYEHRHDNYNEIKV